jgi:hypothetical protein
VSESGTALSLRRVWTVVPVELVDSGRERVEVVAEGVAVDGEGECGRRVAEDALDRGGGLAGGDHPSGGTVPEGVHADAWEFEFH